MSFEEKIYSSFWKGFIWDSQTHLSSFCLVTFENLDLKKRKSVVQISDATADCYWHCFAADDIHPAAFQ